MPQIMIDVQNVSKVYKIYNKPGDRLMDALFPFTKSRYHEFAALNGISFKAEKGDAIGFLGKNGSGKSTLLKIITGVLSPSGGSVSVNGRIASILELGAGFNQEYTGIENIYLNGTIMGFTRAEMDKKLQSIIDFADIGDFINQPVKIYSSGMFARLAFAVSINVEPDILIIDEVLAVGDARFQTKCINKLKQLKDMGTTILFVSHASEQVKRFCNRAIWINEGKIEAEGLSSEIVDIYESWLLFGKQTEIKTESEELPELPQKKEKGKREEIVKAEKAEDEFKLPEDKSILARIVDVEINKTVFHTFDKLSVDITYDIYEEEIKDFLVGAAIYSADHNDYIFGPNTYLEKTDVPKTRGRHKVRYTIPSLQLIKGAFTIDAGIFNNEGMVTIDYKTAAADFEVTNEYFSEGLVYMKHEWEVIK